MAWKQQWPQQHAQNGQSCAVSTATGTVGFFSSSTALPQFEQLLLQLLTAASVHAMQ
jgi:hypothetical protein